MASINRTTINCLRIAVMVLLVMCLLGCHGSRRENQKKPSLPVMLPFETRMPPAVESSRLLLGIDGADWRFMLPLIRMGKLPAIEKLVDRGSRAVLMSQTMASPVEWTLIATGQAPDDNGITGFVVYDEREGKKTVISGNLRKVKALWNIMTDYQRRIDVIGWWATWPAETVLGTVISDLFPYRDEIDSTAFPVERGRELVSFLANRQNVIAATLASDFGLEVANGTIGGPAERRNTADSDPGTKTGLFIRDFSWDIEKTEIYSYSLDRQSPRLTALFLNSTDIASHLFYRFTVSTDENGGWEEDTVLLATYGRMIEKAYCHAERPLIEALERNVDLHFITIVSDHGFTAVPHVMKVRWNMLLADLGLVRFRPESDRMIFRNIDRTESRAWQDPRHPGEELLVVMNAEKSGESIEQLTSLVRRRMESLIDAKGKPLFRFIGPGQSAEQLFFTVALPDLTAETVIRIDGREFFFSRYLNPPHLSGGHRPEGVMVMWGAGIEQGRHLAPLTTYDVLPVVLWSCDIPQSKELVGAVPIGAIRPEALQARPIVSIDSFGERARDNTHENVSEDVNATIKDKLKALGYID